MTVPGWWQAVLLVLAAYRLTRLGGWDAWPPVRKLRARVIGERWTVHDTVPEGTSPARGWRVSEEAVRAVESEVEGLPGKQPTSPVEGVRPGYARPTLAHLTHCPWCLGWWVSLSVWGLWVGLGEIAVFAATPFAFSTAVGLIGRNLDA